jgi:hypothetical protein
VFARATATALPTRTRTCTQPGCLPLFAGDECLSLTLAGWRGLTKKLASNHKTLSVAKGRNLNASGLTWLGFQTAPVRRGGRDGAGGETRLPWLSEHCGVDVLRDCCMQIHRNMLLALALLVANLAMLSAPAAAQTTLKTYDGQLAAANRSIQEGHVKDGVAILGNLLWDINPTKDRDAYWKASASLIEALNQLGDFTSSAQVINRLAATGVSESQATYKQQLLFYRGRNLAYLHNPDEGEKFLNTLTQGPDRRVQNPAQRAAALMLSKIELDRRNISQSAIWMRRAVVGTLVDQAASSEEIIDVLSAYAQYLTSVRRLSEANSIFRRLAPFYDQYMPKRGPKYLTYLTHYLFNLTSLGYWAPSENGLKLLNDLVAGVDIPPEAVKGDLFFQNLYETARNHRVDTEQPQQPLRKRLEDAATPGFLKQPQNRIQFAYYALLAGEIDLAEKFISTTIESYPVDDQYAGYDLLLRSVIAARRGTYEVSISLAEQGLEHIASFHRVAESESSIRLPALSIEERYTLGVIVGMNGGHISTFEQANSLFRLEQYFNRDKAKLSLSAAVRRRELKSGLQGENLRSRDRMQELRDKLLENAVDALFSRILPIRDYSPGQKNDYGPLRKLLELEDKIDTANEIFKTTLPNFSKDGEDRPIELNAVQKLIRPGEALILHVNAGVALITTCIRSDIWMFHVEALDVPALQQMAEDIQGLTSAVQNEPSTDFDGEFVGRSRRIYEHLLGGVTDCLKGTRHILLATDPDFFSIPWNALLTASPPSNRPFQYREAAWLPRSFAFSLLPSVRSLYQIRHDLPQSRANENFLGVGDPALKGGAGESKQIALAPLFVTRGG